MYRVNYGDGEVSQSFKLQADAQAHLKNLTGLPWASVQVYGALGIWTDVL